MKNNAYVCQNDLSSAICDLMDVWESIKDLNPEILEESKDNDNSEITINDCLSDVMSFLDSLKAQVVENKF